MQIEGKLHSWRSLSSWVARATDLTKMQTWKKVEGEDQSPSSTSQREGRPTNLVELQGIEEVVQLPVLLLLLKLDVVLLESVKSELGLVVDVNLERLEGRRGGDGRKGSAFESWTRFDEGRQLDSRSA